VRIGYFRDVPSVSTVINDPLLFLASAPPYPWESDHR
jgi:hypothetical protein